MELRWLTGRKCNTVFLIWLGAGMYTGIGSYFNSDCNPNTIRVNIGKKMLLIASKNIKKGIKKQVFLGRRNVFELKKYKYIESAEIHKRKIVGSAMKTYFNLILKLFTVLFK